MGTVFTYNSLIHENPIVFASSERPLLSLIVCSLLEPTNSVLPPNTTVGFTASLNVAGSLVIEVVEMDWVSVARSARISIINSRSARLTITYKAKSRTGRLRTGLWNRKLAKRSRFHIFALIGSKCGVRREASCEISLPCSSWTACFVNVAGGRHLVSFSWMLVSHPLFHPFRRGLTGWRIYFGFGWSPFLL